MLHLQTHACGACIRRQLMTVCLPAIHSDAAQQAPPTVQILAHAARTARHAWMAHAAQQAANVPTISASLGTLLVHCGVCSCGCTHQSLAVLQNKRPRQVFYTTLGTFTAAVAATAHCYCCHCSCSLAGAAGRIRCAAVMHDGVYVQFGAHTSTTHCHFAVKSILHIAHVPYVSSKHCTR